MQKGWGVLHEFSDSVRGSIAILTKGKKQRASMGVHGKILFGTRNPIAALYEYS